MRFHVLISLSVVMLSAALIAQAPASFEAVSIKAPDPREGIDIKFLPGRLVASNVTLDLLIEQAYALEPRELVGGADWVRAERFDVIATTTGGVGKADMMRMLQSVLADRFKVELGTETRTGTIYVLTAPNVRGLKPPSHPDERPLVQTGREDKKGVISFYYEGHNAPMTALALRLAGEVRTPVDDRTQLPGRYDFRVDYTYDSAFGGLEPDPDFPTLFTALQNQLGLKLVADKGPIEVHVIRNAAKPLPD